MPPREKSRLRTRARARSGRVWSGRVWSVGRGEVGSGVVVCRRAAWPRTCRPHTFCILTREQQIHTSTRPYPAHRLRLARGLQEAEQYPTQVIPYPSDTLLKQYPTKAIPTQSILVARCLQEAEQCPTQAVPTQPVLAESCRKQSTSSERSPPRCIASETIRSSGSGVCGGRGGVRRLGSFGAAALGRVSEGLGRCRTCGRG